MKRIISIAFVLLFIVSTADAYVTVDDIYYNIANGEASVTYGDDIFDTSRYTGNITIPESITVDGNTYPVTSIWHNAFYNCNQLTSVSLPSSIVDIQKYAFYNCKALTRIEIPNSVTSIGEYTFYQCTKLTSVNIPNSVTSIGKNAFDSCMELFELSIDPNPNLTIGVDAFNACSSLEYIMITDIDR